ncbi:MAG: F0F1 ATP synthase subunit delta [Psychrobacter sp.]
MATRLSRRKLSDYAAAEIARGNTAVLKQVAAYLVDSRRTREVRLVVRDIELRLMETGEVMAQVISARKLTSDLEKAVKSYLSGEYRGASVALEASIDESIIGGIIIRTPDAEFDNSIKTRITKLTT